MPSSAVFPFQGENHTHSNIQFVLAGYHIDTDDLCPNTTLDYGEDEVDYAGGGDDEYDGHGGAVDLTDETDGYEYQYEYEEGQTDMDFINDQDYGDWDNSTDFEAILESLRNPFNTSDDQQQQDEEEEEYSDEDFDYEEAFGQYDTVVPDENNCYEKINGTVDPSVEFCQQFGLHDSTLFLNMFSSVDHSQYCLAHIWTYRDLDVVGLADNPTQAK